MKTSLLKGLDAEGARNLKGSFASGKTFRGVLEKLLEKKILAKLTTMRNNDSYGNPSWAYSQADHLGYTRALQEVINLLQSEEK